MHHLTPIERASSPVFPLERGSDVSINAEPLKHSTHIQLFIKLVEPVIFIQGFESHHIGERPPSILRGSLIIRILKPTKLKRIALNFKGFSRTEWPEGIPPKKQEFLEINDIVNHTWPFYQHKSKFVPLGANPNDYEYLIAGSGASMYNRLPTERGETNTSSDSPAAAAGSRLSDLRPITSLSSRSSDISSSDETSQNSNKGTMLHHDSNGNHSKKSGLRSLSPLGLFRMGSGHETSNQDTHAQQHTQHQHQHQHHHHHHIQSPFHGSRRQVQEQTCGNGLRTTPSRPASSHPLRSEIIPLEDGDSHPHSPSRQKKPAVNLTNQGILQPTPIARQHLVSGSNVTSSDPAADNTLRKTISNSSFHDLISSVVPSRTRTQSPISEAHSLASTGTTETNSFVFQPGDYIYTFEQVIPHSYPATIKGDFGFVEYSLLATVERYGAFKSSLIARLPVTIIRTQSDNSVEESEPIIVNRDWEGQLFYDIVISSKDIILDAFLPIHFSFYPLDKVTLHRIRIYITETMEYYCKGKKIHRLEPTKKYLLAEKNGPKLDVPHCDDKNAGKAKYLGNLLVDPQDGYVANRDFDFQVYIPSKFTDSAGRVVNLHPDTVYDKIKSNHWIKLSLRLSKLVDGKRKHYEISIDSPIHVLHRLCSHANVLLPCYDTHTLTSSGQAQFPTVPHGQQGNDSRASSNHGQSPIGKNDHIFHASNIFFPREVLQSSVLSAESEPMDPDMPYNSSSFHLKSSSVALKQAAISQAAANAATLAASTTTSDATEHSKSRTDSKTHASSPSSSVKSARENLAAKYNTIFFQSPCLSSNIYQPKSIERSLASSQAIPLSPIASPSMSQYDDNEDTIGSNSEDELNPPPAFDFDSPMGQPPPYDDVVRISGMEEMNKSPRDFGFSSDRITDAQQLRNEHVEEDTVADASDIAVDFRFQGSLSQGQAVPTGILRSHSPRLRTPSSFDSRLTTKYPSSTLSTVTDRPPSTILTSTTRTDTPSCPSLHQLLESAVGDEQSRLDTQPQRPTGNNDSEHSSLKAFNPSFTSASDFATMEPLLRDGSFMDGHGKVTETVVNSKDNGKHTQNDSNENLLIQPVEMPDRTLASEVDLTALYNRSTEEVWHHLRMEGLNHHHNSHHHHTDKLADTPSPSPRKENTLTGDTPDNHLEYTNGVSKEAESAVSGDV